MKRLLLLILLVIGFAASNLNAQAPVKRILLEEFTGSWCGWCPRGIWAIEQLEEKYPGQFITASIHNGDPMVTPWGDSIQAGKLLSTITGYPDGWLQRRVYGTKLSIDAASWDTAMTRLMAEPAVAGVTVANVTFDPATRMLSATVNVKFEVDQTGPFRINMYVVEDSVSGPANTTWDQHNYLTNRAGYEDNPFFDKPAVVPNYQHMHVLRAVLGNVTGIAGVIPDAATAGSTYSQTFTYKLPDNIKADQARVIGFVCKYKKTTLKQNEILNVDQAKVTNLKGIGMTLATAKSYITATRSGETTQDVTITNPTNVAAKVNLSIDIPSSVLPTGWQASVTPASIDVPAKGNVTATLKIVAPANANYVSATVSAVPVADGYVGRQSLVTVNALSAGTKYVAYGSDGFIFNHMDSKYSADFATVPLTEELLAAYPSENFEVGIFPNTNYFDVVGITGTPAIVPAINALFAAGKKALVTSTFGLYYAFDPASAYYQYTNGDEAGALFNDKLGITYESLTSRTSSGNATQSTVTGIDGDVVGNGIAFKSLFYQTDVFTITNTATTKPILYLDDDPTIIGGFRYDGGNGQRLVFLDLNLGLTLAADASKAKTLVTKSMDFLLNGSSAVEPTSGTSFSLEQNVPNPVSGMTSISYNLSERMPVILTVHDLLGREVARLANSTQDMGSHSVKFDASNLPSGTYVYTLNAGGKTVEKTMMVTK